MKSKQTGQDLTPAEIIEQEARRIAADRAEADRLQAEEVARTNKAMQDEIAGMNLRKKKPPGQ